MSHVQFRSFRFQIRTMVLVTVMPVGVLVLVSRKSFFNLEIQSCSSHRTFVIGVFWSFKFSTLGVSEFVFDSDVSVQMVWLVWAEDDDYEKKQEMREKNKWIQRSRRRTGPSWRVGAESPEGQSKRAGGWVAAPGLLLPDCLPALGRAAPAPDLAPAQSSWRSCFRRPRLQERSSLWRRRSLLSRSGLAACRSTSPPSWLRRIPGGLLTGSLGGVGGVGVGESEVWEIENGGLYLGETDVGGEGAYEGTEKRDSF